MVKQAKERFVSTGKTTKQRCASKPQRDREAIRLAMLKAAGTDADHGADPLPTTSCPMSVHDRGEIGLTQQELEDRRWCLSPSVAKERLLGVGLPYEGRRAGLIYSWRSIFKAEGVEDSIARSAAKDEYPDLYDNLMDTSEAAKFLGYRDPSSIRKLVLSGDISQAAYVTFGTRGIYRFRPGPLVAMRKTTSVGRIV